MSNENYEKARGAQEATRDEEQLLEAGKRRGFTNGHGHRQFKSRNQCDWPRMYPVGIEASHFKHHTPRPLEIWVRTAQLPVYQAQQRLIDRREAATHVTVSQRCNGVQPLDRCRADSGANSRMMQRGKRKARQSEKGV